jgi:hypothetical protein
VKQAATMSQLAQLDFLAEAKTAFVGPPGIDKTRLLIALEFRRPDP